MDSTVNGSKKKNYDSFLQVTSPDQLDPSQDINILPNDEEVAVKNCSSSSTSTATTISPTVFMTSKATSVCYQSNADSSLMRSPSSSTPLLFQLFFSHNNQIEYKFPSLSHIPERRFKRHRAVHFHRTNEFRHWWKTSRLLVRLAGAFVWWSMSANWTLLGSLRLRKKQGMKDALHSMKQIGRGGTNEIFLDSVFPFTRTLRLYMALGRAVEARPDNRFWEVLVAESMAFMGNRTARWWARECTDFFAGYILFPILASKKLGIGSFIESYLPGKFRLIIIALGLIRAFSPFVCSFFGSRLGRQVTYRTYARANYRWKPMQSIQQTHPTAGMYRPTNDDPILLHVAKKVAEAIGHGDYPEEVRQRLLLQPLGLRLVACGSGGYCKFQLTITTVDHLAKLFPDSAEVIQTYEDELDGFIIYLHVTPYGPSILDEVPRFIVLERKRMIYQKEYPSSSDGSIHNDTEEADHFLEMALSEPNARLQGFTYSGAFFTSQEWAALKERYDRELLCYDRACHLMGRPNHTATTLYGGQVFPPSDLMSLKAFIRSGRFPWKIRRDNRAWNQVTKSKDHLAQTLRKLMKNDNAPHGVIFYMEGLDCAGKSSTGGLIRDALSDAGYDITAVQYNRPPTEEAKLHPWMWRFAKPKSQSKKYATIVWDRGPAGDFVYGNLNRLSDAEKAKRYREFIHFDENCRSESILFCKILFITDRDAIAKTLGKRLAHKKIVRDLHVWLDANSTYHSDRVGLDEIEHHIDPSDFVAFNKYDTNLRNFYDFVRRTDDMAKSFEKRDVWCRSVESNPWMVVCTSTRHEARLRLMSGFERQIKSFQQRIPMSSVRDETAPLVARSFDNDVIRKKESQFINPAAFLYLLVLMIIAYSYMHQTWNVPYFWFNSLNDIKSARDTSG